MLNIIFIRPPARKWPFLIRMADNFLTPLGYLSLISYLKENTNHNVGIIECPMNQIGWKTLEKKLRKLSPDVVCTGLETLNSVETNRAFRLAKKINPNVVTIGGNHHYTALAREEMAKEPIDFVIKGEGELSLTELVNAIDAGRSVKKIKGIYYKDAKGSIVENENRPLISDLDSLPMPAFDLVLKNNNFINKAIYWRGVTVSHSRGCTNSCKFCSCWVQMSQSKNGKRVPCRRVRSVASCLDEIEYLHEKYKVKHFLFTDDTWNADPKWLSAFCDEIFRRKLKITWFAFCRADFLDRDRKSGLLKKLIRAGMAHIFVGIERVFDSELDDIRKNVHMKKLTGILTHLSKTYPHVTLQGTLLTGFPNETKESLQKMLEFTKTVDIDSCFFHVFTPHPGTELYDEMKAAGKIEVTDFSKYDWINPVIRSKEMTREDIYIETMNIQREYFLNKVPKMIKGMFHPHPIKRGTYINHMSVILSSVLNVLVNLKNPFKPEVGQFKMVKPRWYDK